MTLLRQKATVSAIHGLPEQIVVYNGPEFISNALDAWAYERGIAL